jgi:hypothetical protein
VDTGTIFSTLFDVETAAVIATKEEGIVNKARVKKVEMNPAGTIELRKGALVTIV